MKLMIEDIMTDEQITSFFILASVQIRRSKTGQNLLILTLCDKSGKINGYLWNHSMEIVTSLKENTVVKIKGYTTMTDGALSINIEQIRAAQRYDEVDLRDMLDVVIGGIDLWRQRLFEYVDLIRDVNCKEIINAFTNDEKFMELFMTSLGGVSIHHNYLGGLLEHTVNLMAQSALYADQHPGLLDKDLLLTGAFLHDIGKTQEICWETAVEFTLEGKLLGHVVIGVILLEEKLRHIRNYPTELALLLKHMILSHHGSTEYGSMVPPAPPEAIVLHLLDNLDTVANHLYCHMGISDANSEWSIPDRALDTSIYQKKIKKSMVRIPEGVQYAQK